jgi:hypothetical protein
MGHGKQLAILNEFIKRGLFDIDAPSMGNILALLGEVADPHL